MNPKLLSAEDYLKLLTTIKATTPLSEKRFIYNNSLFTAAGLLISKSKEKKLSYQQYARLMEEKVFIPLAMKRTTASIENLINFKNVASGHKISNGDYIPAGINEMHWVKKITPAGGAFSSVTDMAHFIQMELDNGQFGDQPYVSSKNLLHRRLPFAKMHSSSYGLGWVISKIKNHPVIWHNGSTFDYESYLAMVPNQTSGFVILTNGTFGKKVASLVATKIYETWFGEDLNSAQSLNELTSPFSLSKTTTSIVTGDALYEPDFGYPLSRSQKTALKTALGWYNSEFGEIEMINIGESFFLRSKTGGFEIWSNKKDGKLSDFITKDNYMLNLANESLIIDSIEDRHTYVFQKKTK